MLTKLWSTVLIYLTIAWNWTKFTAEMTWAEMLSAYYHVSFYVVGVPYKALSWVQGKIAKALPKILSYLLVARSKW